ncbi:hypothetical protein ASC72_10385 [Flavobacterium sp. Root420]|nr:hypothetical protein ASC72_10385 [Flavobacterium sp. Root420]
MKPRIIVYILLVILNLVSLYFIMALFSYDEILAYAISGGTRRTDPKQLAYLLFVNCLLNLYFLSFVLMEGAFKNKR